jgi:hypothetical protein
MKQSRRTTWTMLTENGNGGGEGGCDDGGSGNTGTMASLQVVIEKGKRRQHEEAPRKRHDLRQAIVEMSRRMVLPE